MNCRVYFNAILIHVIRNNKGGTAVRSMYKLIGWLLVFVFGVGAIFFGLFSLLQHESCYKATLAQLGPNYEKLGKRPGATISTAYKPYLHTEISTINHWDAALYRRIRDEGYTNSDRLAKEKLAFYPLYPYLWRYLHIDGLFIVIFNYLLFGAGIIVLFISLVPQAQENYPVFVLSLLFPTAACFYLPYAESLFLFTLALAVFGIMRRNYWLFFAGAFLFAMTRPSALMFLAALGAANTIYLFRHRNIKSWIRGFITQLSPGILGYACVTWVQFRKSGSWMAYFESMDIWPTESGYFNTITDWSLEGFGMTVFAIFFVALPALIYVLYTLYHSFRKPETVVESSLFKGTSEFQRAFLLLVSLLFISINLIYTFLSSGNVLNGFSRYTMAVPFFFIALYLLIDKLGAQQLLRRILAFMLGFLLLFVFLNNVNYGSGHRLAFSNAGLFISMLLFALYVFGTNLSLRQRWICLACLLIPALVWQTYLYNMFLSDAWIFT
jgi:hypothetical protein